MKTYTNISEIEDYNRSKGFHFFDADSMRFFKSRIGYEIIHGNIFITSEKHEAHFAGINEPRKYTVRCILESGQIEELSEFQAFDTKAQALKYAYRLPERISEAIECAKNQFNGKPQKGLDFVALALIEPQNRKDKKYTTDSFTGACSWLCEHWEQTGNSWLKGYAESYTEKLLGEHV